MACICCIAEQERTVCRVERISLWIDGTIGVNSTKRSIMSSASASRMIALPLEARIGRAGAEDQQWAIAVAHRGERPGCTWHLGLPGRC